jgi:uncharacterized protein
VSAHKLPANLRPFLLIAIAVLVIGWIAWPRTPEHILYVHGITYKLEAVIDTQAQLKGLGGRARMPRDQGMLFAYDQSAAGRCFWMKDMRFALDIIWIDSYKKVVTVAPDISPKTYPGDSCPSGPSQFVIELNAGEAQRAGIGPGMTLQF